MNTKSGPIATYLVVLLILAGVFWLAASWGLSGGPLGCCFFALLGIAVVGGLLAWAACSNGDAKQSTGEEVDRVPGKPIPTLKNMRNGDIYWDRELVDLQELNRRLTESDRESSSGRGSTSTLKKSERSRQRSRGQELSIVYYREAPSAVPTPAQLDVLIKLQASQVETEHFGVTPEWGRLTSFELQQDRTQIRLQAAAGKSAVFFLPFGTEEVQFALSDAGHVVRLLDDIAYFVSSHRIVETMELEADAQLQKAKDTIELRLTWDSGACQHAVYARNSAPSHILTFCWEIGELAKSCQVAGEQLPPPLDRTIVRFCRSAGRRQRSDDIVSDAIPESRLECPHCGKRYRLRPEAIGKTTRCTNCGARFVVEVHG